MSNLSILKTAIRQFDNLYSLNDLHIASGSEKKHQPTFFVRLETTKELISEIQKEDPTTPVIICKNGIGTYACEELVLAYAMWISPKFHLVVLRAFLAMHKGELQNQPQQLALPEPEKKYTFELTERELRALVWLWCGHKQMNLLLAELEQPLEAIGSRFSGIVYPIEIVSVQSVIQFSKEYEKRVEESVQKNVAIQTAERELIIQQKQAEIVKVNAQAKADAEVIQAKADAEKVRLAGEAEAAAIRAKGEALKENRQLVELTAAEKWNGVLPTTMTPNGTVPFVKVGQ